MNATDELSGKIHGSDFDRSFTNIYGFDRMENQKKRYCNLLKDFELVFGGSGYLRLFSAPGRIEIGGNHTDHNNGRVIAAAIGLDSIAAARSNRENIIRVHSKDFSSDTVTLDDLGVHSTETGSSSALIRGIAARFQQMGYAIGGFDAYTATDVPTGSGLSSSAAFEVLIGTILNHVYNAGRIPDYEIAAICQYAENVYFGKPSGLMDQLASAVGGIVFIDFKDKRHPAVETIDIDFDNAGYSVCIVDTGGSHCELTDEYASIPREMILVAEELGVHSLREATADKLMLNIEAIRRRLGDRALLRAFHFFGEDERVALQAKALQYDDFTQFMQLVVDSGRSSFQYLQNIYSNAGTNANGREQGLAVALCLSEQLLHGIGAWRVHGGGFAGTTFNLVPKDLLPVFCQTMESVFGNGRCHILSIRHQGGLEVRED